jgi:DNA-binding MarR family transcriptional regulator
MSWDAVTPGSVREAQELRVAIGQVARRMRRVYASDPGGPGFTEVAVLVRLDRDGPASPTALADSEGVTSQAIAGACRELERRGLVRRRRAGGDGRRVLVGVTDRGRALLGGREQGVIEALTRTLDTDFTPDERERLTSIVPLLRRLAERM